jgi:hypothetical protein
LNQDCYGVTLGLDMLPERIAYAIEGLTGLKLRAVSA